MPIDINSCQALKHTNGAPPTNITKLYELPWHWWSKLDMTLKKQTKTGIILPYNISSQCQISEYLPTLKAHKCLWHVTIQQPKSMLFKNQHFLLTRTFHTHFHGILWKIFKSGLACSIPTFETQSQVFLCLGGCLLTFFMALKTLWSHQSVQSNSREFQPQGRKGLMCPVGEGGRRKLFWPILTGRQEQIIGQRFEILL